MPDWKAEIRRRLAGSGLSAARGKEIADELSQHLQDRYEEWLRDGSTEDEAERQALAELSDCDFAGELATVIGRVPPPAGIAAPGQPTGGRPLADLAADVRYALRTLRKAPGFAAVALLTLALGIGANTALFSIVNAVLLNPLPYDHPDQLVMLHESKQNFPSGSISYPNFRDWRSNNHTFAGMAILRGTSFGLTGLGEPEQLNGVLVAADFFRILGLAPIAGRTFSAGEDEIGAAPTIVVTEGFWRRKLGGSTGVVGRMLTLDGKGFTILGVVPAIDDIPSESVRTADVYMPVGQWGNPFLTHRTAGLGFHGVGRLKPGVTIEQARADMDAVTRALTRAYPDEDKDIGATLVPFRDALVGNVRPVLLLLFGAVGFVLLIACVNVANLMLARALSRQRELAVRAALGASRSRIVRQLIAESVVLASAGGALGLLLAAWSTRAAVAALPAALPRVDRVHLDARVLLFTAAVSIGAGVVFGLIPAVRAARRDPQGALGEGGRGASGARHRLQAAFVAVEMAMALVLLVGAGLMVRTLQHLWAIDPGFRPAHVLTFQMSLPPAVSREPAETIRARLRDVHHRLAATPGVRAVSLSWGSLPLAGDDEELFWMEGQPKPSSPSDMNWALRYIVEPGYLDAMGLTLRRGRFFTEADRADTPPVVVVDDALARKYFGRADPVGKRVNIDGRDTPALIVGVVGHVKQWALDGRDADQLQAQMYRPLAQMQDSAVPLIPSGFGVVMRDSGAVPDLFAAVRRTAAAISPDTIVYDAQTMNELMGESLAARRFSMTLFGTFAALALTLASVGLFGVVSYLVGQRTHEIGVRLALGAREDDVLRWVIGQGARMVLVGVAVGTLAALALTRVMAHSSLLFGVTATDPLTFASVALLLSTVALAACYIPARRAARVDPLTALRAE
ncbi:MAG: ADOP family duplicated permease [Betaproteobacteria bacterium]